LSGISHETVAQPNQFVESLARRPVTELKTCRHDLL